MSAPLPLSPDPARRVASLDWARLAHELDERGFALTGRLLSDAQCEALIAGYDADEHYRSRILMARHGFGQGEYKYYAYPLPQVVQSLRDAIYGPLAERANAWSAALGMNDRYPTRHEEFLDRCRKAGQARPTPLILRYDAGDYNCLHQDLYGELHFPLQLTVLLSRPTTDFDGGEFVLTEQRPRRQSRVSVVPLARGEAVIFPCNHRPVSGKRGIHRVTMRHGVSEIRAGRRFALGVIFHDAR